MGCQLSASISRDLQRCASSEIRLKMLSISSACISWESSPCQSQSSSLRSMWMSRGLLWDRINPIRMRSMSSRGHGKVKTMEVQRSLVLKAIALQRRETWDRTTGASMRDWSVSKVKRWNISVINSAGSDSMVVMRWHFLLSRPFREWHTRVEILDA